MVGINDEYKLEKIEIWMTEMRNNISIANENILQMNQKFRVNERSEDLI
jgi:hypothetical protein